MQESGLWECRFEIAKYEGEITEDAEPYEVIETDNALVNGGVSVLWQCLLGNGTATPGGALTFFDSANAAIGVGDGSAVHDPVQNNLQGGNKLRKGMDSGYPQHTDGTVVGAKTITFRTTFDTAQANYAWAEVGVFNSATDGSGRMLNRKVQALGTKSNTSSWQITASITIQ